MGMKAKYKLTKLERNEGRIASINGELKGGTNLV